MLLTVPPTDCVVSFIVVWVFPSMVLIFKYTAIFVSAFEPPSPRHSCRCAASRRFVVVAGGWVLYGVRAGLSCDPCGGGGPGWLALVHRLE